MAEELGERTELPSAQRRQQARERGQVPKSQELGSAIDLIGAAVLISVIGAWTVQGLAAITRHLLDSKSSGTGLRVDDLRPALIFASSHAAMIVAPFLLVMFAIVFAGQFFQIGPLLSGQALVPKPERLNPLAGFKRLFSKRSVIKTIVNVIKLTLIGFVVMYWVRLNLRTIVFLSMLDALPAMALIVHMLVDLLVWILAILLTLGLADLAYQRYQLTQDLRMTKQEVKDEHRSMEGDPELKGRRLRMAREIALQKLRQTVPKADVIVTNPTHYAIALQYDGKAMGAPKVVAKGADFMAFRIREIAALHRIPIVEKPALARALHAGVPVGRQISPEFYEAVAEILAYVYRLKGRAA